MYTRLETYSVVVFAEDVDSVDTLFSNLIVATDRVAPNGGVSFDTYQVEFDQYSKRVPIIRFDVNVKTPVVDEIKPLTEITDESSTCEWDTELA